LVKQIDPKEIEEHKLRCGTPATFQGDERDVIFLSLVIAPNHSYRALTGRSDLRRFNVAMSRARDQVWLFTSVGIDQLSREDLRYRLLHYFKTWNELLKQDVYEKKEHLEHIFRSRRRRLGEQPEPYESWFEVDVAYELLKRGYRVVPQYSVANYRIDLVVEGITHRLAVECDGEAWHGMDRYEADLERQRQLERAGWRFVRIRESEFYANREQAIRRVLFACEELGIKPVGEV